MKTVIVGAGAMGTLMAAKLCMSGHGVWLFEINPERVTQIREKGIVLEDAAGRQQVASVRVTSDPEALGTVDTAVFLVKSFDTDAAVRRVRPSFSEKTTVLTLQNGLGNIEAIQSLVPANQILAGTTSHGALLVDHGHVRHTGTGDTFVGEVDINQASHLEKIIELFSGSGIAVMVADDIYALLWAKLLVNICINPLTAITGITNGQLPEMPHLMAVVQKVLAEGMQVASAVGVRLPSETPLDKVLAVCRNTASNRSSMLQDVLAGRKTEIDYINGAVVRLGKQHGVSVPVNRILVHLVKSIEQVAGG